MHTGELDKSTLNRRAIIDYDRSYREDYIVGLIEKAAVSWEGVGDADEWWPP
ncbi:MAG: hypothetical protein ABIU09_09525 [Pyrinomonadaceae bacterium]